MRRKLTVIKRPYIWFRSTRKRNKILAIVGVLFLFLIIIGQVLSATTQPTYEYETVKRSTISEIVSETGNVNTAGRFDVNSPSTGIVEEIYVENDTFVQPEQALFYVRSTATDQEQATAYASYQSALSALNTAEQSSGTFDAQMWQAHQALLNARNAANYKNNNTKNPTTLQDYTELEKESIDAGVVQAEKNFAALEEKVKEVNVAIEAARAQVNSTLLAYQATIDLTVRAPAAGTITNLSVSPGDKVSADTQSTAALGGTATEPVLTIANLNDYSIKLALNEIDIPKVHEGQTADITLDAFPLKQFKGKVSHVDSVGTNTQGVVTYNVMVVLSNPDNNIRPGMTANVDLEVDTAENVLSVSNSAVKPYQGGRAVRVADPENKSFKYIPVEIGIRGDERTEIISGLTEGQEVITALPNDQLNRPGLF